MLGKEEKSNIVAKAARTKGDTGSSEVQIAIFTARIEQISGHLKVYPKDTHSRRGLIGLVGKRNKQLKYLKNTNFALYESCLKSTKKTTSAV
ncbi:MAG: 30S ribosomal protein S15 [bacterium]